MEAEVPRYSESIYKSLRGLRRDVPEYTEENYKMRMPVSNRICTDIKVHYSKIPVDCYCPKYGFFEQKVVVGRTLIFFDAETLTFTKSRQRNAFNHFWDVSEKPYIPLANREKEKETSEYNAQVARGHSSRWIPETFGQDENIVKVKNESGQNPESEPEKSVVHVDQSDDTHTDAYTTNRNDVQDQNKAVLYSVTKSKDEPVPTHYAAGNRYSLMIQPYSACCARATDLIKHMWLSMSNREEIIGGRKPYVSISSYIVTADRNLWLPTVDIYVETTGNHSDRKHAIQPYSACCARATDFIRHMRLSMSNREEIVGDNIHVEKVEEDSERNLNTATFQNGEFENALINHEPPKYGNETCILDNVATFKNECPLEESAVSIEKLEQDYNTDFVTGILGIYARGQEQFNIENILTYTDNDDNDDEDDHGFMSGLFGIYARN